MLKTALWAIVCAVVCATYAFAQPPGLIRVVRNGSIQSYGTASLGVNILGMGPVSGPAENWLIELHDSFASLEELDTSLSTAAASRVSGAQPLTPEDDLLPSSRTLIAVYRAGLSYRPDQAAQVLPRARYLEVTMLRIRPGTEAEFAKALKLRGLGFDSVNLDRPEIVYQIVSGARAGTYISLAPLVSLRSMDDGRAATPAYAEGAETTAKKLAADTEILRENFWFRLEPRLSYVLESFASANPEFWRPPPR